MSEELDESILHIDEHHLDKECIQLPSQYHQAAFAAASTNQDIDELKSELKVVEATFHLAVRKEPAKYGLEKITEGALDELTLLNPKVRELDKKIRALENKQTMQKLLVASLDVKKRSLSNLVDLHVAGWHAQVKPSGEGREALKKISRDRVSRPIAWKKNKDRDE